MSTPDRHWKPLGRLAGDALTQAREQAHWGVQVVSAVGETFLPHAPDTGHTNMRWLPAHGALAGGRIEGAAPLRVALRVPDLTLLLLGADEALLESRPLAGISLAEADRWAAEQIRTHSGGALDRTLVHASYALPPHEIEAGQPFRGASEAALEELAAWFHDGDRSLRGAVNGVAQASPVRCWPHHFDLGSLVALADGEGESARSIGLGLSPGDGEIPQPYWYVNPYPNPPHPRLPSLDAGGRWHTEGWLGAVLEADALAGPGDPEAQASQAKRFLSAALSAARQLLD